jgi:hypothetical protein
MKPIGSSECYPIGFIRPLKNQMRSIHDNHEELNINE